jgi:TM2 domain-containing membrane protein YozV
MQPMFKTCPTCGQSVPIADPICPKCGYQYTYLPQGYNPPPGSYPQMQQPMYPPAYPPQMYQPPYMPGGIWVTPGSHSPALAVILSLLVFCGLGQIYNKQAAKGLTILGVSVLLALVTCGLSILITIPLAAIDAGMIGGRLNRGEVIGPWQFF